MTLLRERGFRNFWLATSVSLLGDQIALLALPLVAVLVLDAGAGQMGLLTAARSSRICSSRYRPECGWIGSRAVVAS